MRGEAELIMSIDLKPNSLELGRNLEVLNLGSSRKPQNKPHTLVCGRRKVLLILIKNRELLSSSAPRSYTWSYFKVSRYTYKAS